MKRNLEVKKNVDDMIFQVLNYINKSGVPDDEAEVLVYEILSSIIMWNCEWDPENIDITSVTQQVQAICTNLVATIPHTLQKQINEHGYRLSGE